ncbi:hypothetical protein C0995_005352 [Termitomyces sp. Mi166|nr:hypothetical protein C0995_005352 [Termitomyces sp. Mi166\
MGSRLCHSPLPPSLQLRFSLCPQPAWAAMSPLFAHELRLRGLSSLIGKKLIFGIVFVNVPRHERKISPPAADVTTITGASTTSKTPLPPPTISMPGTQPHSILQCSSHRYSMRGVFSIPNNAHGLRTSNHDRGDLEPVETRATVYQQATAAVPRCHHLLSTSTSFGALYNHTCPVPTLIYTSSQDNEALPQICLTARGRAESHVIITSPGTLSMNTMFVDLPGTKNIIRVFPCLSPRSLTFSVLTDPRSLTNVTNVMATNRSSSFPTNSRATDAHSIRATTARAATYSQTSLGPTQVVFVDSCLQHETCHPRCSYYVPSIPVPVVARSLVQEAMPRPQLHHPYPHHQILYAPMTFRIPVLDVGRAPATSTLSPWAYERRVRRLAGSLLRRPSILSSFLRCAWRLANVMFVGRCIRTFGAFKPGIIMPSSTAGSASSHDSAQLLPPPRFPGGANRDSTISSSAASFVSLDSKYPLSHRDSAFPSTPRGVLVPYEYDPTADELELADEEDMIHDPAVHGVRKTRFPWRGILNITVLMGLILALLCLFVVYPVLTFYGDEARNCRIDGNIRINATGQASVLLQMPDLIDTAMPDDAKTRTGFDGHEYELVFSDEFEVDGR